MASVMVMVDVEDATVESLSSALQSERVASDVERAVRQTLDVPVEKRVMVEPFRNGLVLSVSTSITVKSALRGVKEILEVAPTGVFNDLERDEVREAYTIISEGLRVVTENGG